MLRDAETTSIAETARPRRRRFLPAAEAKYSLERAQGMGGESQQLTCASTALDSKSEKRTPEKEEGRRAGLLSQGEKRTHEIFTPR